MNDLFMNGKVADNKEIKAVCKKCNKQAPASEFILDHVYRLMVCPACVRERKDKASVLAKEKPISTKPEKPKPAGWDVEDEYLEKAQKQRTKPAFERLDKDRVKYTCLNCKFKIVYTISKKYPTSCPYCGTLVKL